MHIKPQGNLLISMLFLFMFVPIFSKHFQTDAKVNTLPMWNVRNFRIEIQLPPGLIVKLGITKAKLVFCLNLKSQSLQNENKWKFSLNYVQLQAMVLITVAITSYHFE